MRRHPAQKAFRLYGEKPKVTPVQEVPEKDIQKAIVDWLNSLPGVAVWRQNTGAQTFSYTNKAGLTKQRFIRFGQRGQCDTTGLANGVRIEVEVKRPGEFPSNDQHAWMEMIRSRGGIAFYADSLRSCVGQMKDEFLKRGWRWRVEWEIR